MLRNLATEGSRPDFRERSGVRVLLIVSLRSDPELSALPGYLTSPEVCLRWTISCCK